MRWLRWRLRTLAVLIALIALALAAPIEARRRATRRHRTYHAEQARNYRHGVADLQRDAGLFRQRASLHAASATHDGFLFSGPPVMLSPGEWAEWVACYDKSAETFRSQAANHALMLQKYERAVYRPWESLPADPWESFVAGIP